MGNMRLQKSVGFPQNKFMTDNKINLHFCLFLWSWTENWVPSTDGWGQTIFNKIGQNISSGEKSGKRGGLAL